MGAQITIEDRPATMIEWQVDRLGYTRCGDHIDRERCGVITLREATSLRRSAETDDRALWVCDTCQRHIIDWPTREIMVQMQIEHTTCRIF